METLDRDAFGQPEALVPGEHVCWIVDHAEDRSRGAVAWAEQGIDAGERVVWVEDEASKGDFLADLERHGVAWREPYAQGALLVLDPREALLVEGRFDVPARMALHTDMIKESVDSGFSAVRMAAESVPAIGIIPDLEGLLAYEQGLDALTRELPVSVMCFYDRPALGARLTDFVPVHARGIVAPLLRMSADPGRVELSGEVDLSNSDLVAALLVEAEPLDGVLLVDMTRLRFIDIGGTAHMVALSDRLRADARVRVLDPPPHLARILSAGGFTHELELVGAAG